MSELEVLPVRLKRGINEVTVRWNVDGELNVALIYVPGTFRKKALPDELFTRICSSMEMAMGPGPYSIRAQNSALSRHEDPRFPGKDILLYKALFSGQETFDRARKMWKTQFNYRAIEGWYPVPIEGMQWINYHCIWIGDRGLEDE